MICEAVMNSAARQCANSAYAELDNMVVSGGPVCDFPAPSGSGWHFSQAEAWRG
jgi:hypothetical protein